MWDVQNAKVVVKLSEIEIAENIEDIKENWNHGFKEAGMITCFFDA